MNVTTHGLCPDCGHLNELKWNLCDSCGKRLPWSVPEETRKRIADLSDEQLNVLFSPPRESKVPFLLTRQGKGVVAAAMILLSILWWMRG